MNTFQHAIFGSSRSCNQKFKKAAHRRNLHIACKCTANKHTYVHAHDTGQLSTQDFKKHIGSWFLPLLQGQLYEYIKMTYTIHMHLSAIIPALRFVDTSIGIRSDLQCRKASMIKKYNSDMEHTLTIQSHHYRNHHRASSPLPVLSFIVVIISISVLLYGCVLWVFMYPPNFPLLACLLLVCPCMVTLPDLTCASPNRISSNGDTPSMAQNKWCQFRTPSSHC